MGDMTRYDAVKILKEYYYNEICESDTCPLKIQLAIEAAIEYLTESIDNDKKFFEKKSINKCCNCKFKNPTISNCFICFKDLINKN